MKTSELAPGKTTEGPAQISAPGIDVAILEKVVLGGDLSQLTPPQKLDYHIAVCQRLGLDPLLKPFEYIKLNGQLRLYARRDATDQLRRVHNISVEITNRETSGDVYTVIARGSLPDGRHDESSGIVSVAGLRGETLANAMLKAETKAKRRVTLSLVGLGSMGDAMDFDRPDDISKVSENELRRRIGKMLLDLSDGDLPVAIDRLRELSKFTDDNGQEVGGVESTFSIGGRRLRATYGKIKRLHQEWKSEHSTDDGEKDQTMHQL